MRLKVCDVHKDMQTLEAVLFGGCQRASLMVIIWSARLLKTRCSMKKKSFSSYMRCRAATQSAFMLKLTYFEMKKQNGEKQNRIELAEKLLILENPRLLFFLRLV